jgi:hypothetical protein
MKKTMTKNNLTSNSHPKTGMLAKLELSEMLNMLELSQADSPPMMMISS